MSAFSSSPLTRPSSVPEIDPHTASALLIRAQHGDAHALASLQDRYLPRMEAFASRSIGDREEAADLAITAWTRAYRSLSRLEDPIQFESWLFAILRNVCRDALRKMKRRPQTISIEGRSSDGEIHPEARYDIADADAPEGWTAWLKRQDHQRLRAALDRLPPEIARTILLHGLYGVTLADLAQSAATARSRYARGLRYLRRILEAEEA